MTYKTDTPSRRKANSELIIQNMLKTEQTMKECTSELALDQTAELIVRGYVYR
jgi:hypothetical protein